MAVVAAAAACSSSGDDAVSSDSSPAGSDSTAAPPSTDEIADGAPDVGSSETTEAAAAEPESDTDPVPVDAVEPVPGNVMPLIEDAQALCDALDQEKLRGVVGDFVELRPDDLFQEGRSLCQVLGDRLPIAGIWLFADRSEREDLHDFSADPYEPCEISGFDAACQTHTGSPDSFNGWPAVFIGLGAMAIEFHHPDPAVAQEFAAALVDDFAAG